MQEKNIQHKRPQTCQKRVYKNATQPSLNVSNYFESNVTDPFIIQKLKRALPSQYKNTYHDKSNNRLLIQQNYKDINKKNKQILGKPEHQILYKRGIRIERSFYANLTTQILELQQKIQGIGRLNAVQIFQFKQKYLNQFLMIFFKQMGGQCYQKSIFVTKLWDTIKKIFQQLVKRLIKQLNFNQKQLLKECEQTHENYQRKFEDFKNQLGSKDKQINKLKNIIAKIAFKKRKKCRKNKQMSQGIRQMVGRLSNVEKQRNQLKSQYINMLTLGYKGGMQYSQAKKYTINKFGIQKELIQNSQSQQSQTSNSSQISQNPKQKLNKICSCQKNRQKLCNKQKTKKNYSSDNIPKQIIFNAKRKYLYGINRQTIPQDELDSDQQFSLNSIIKENNFVQTQTLQEQIDENANDLNTSRSQQKYLNDQKSKKYLLNKRIQTTFNFNFHQVEKDCNGTNLGIVQKYRDDLIKNKQVQTQIIRSKLNQKSSANIQTQYSKQDFQDYLSQTIKQQIFTQNFAYKQKDEPTYKLKLNIQSEICSEQRILQNTVIKQNPIDQNKSSEDNQNQEQQIIEAVTIKKKQRKLKKSQIKKTKNKQNRPSIFNKSRASMMATTSFFNHNLYTNIQQNIKKTSLNKATSYERKQSTTNLSKDSQFISFNKQINKLELRSIVAYNSNKTQPSALQSQKFQKTEHQSQQMDLQEDYLRTDMLSVMQNMSKLSPKGIYIDEAMIFLLKKSLFRIKHENCDNVFKKNIALITKIRSQICSLRSVKAQNLISMKSVFKILAIAYDVAFSQLFQRNLTFKPQRNKSRRVSQKFGCQKKNQFQQQSAIKINKQINLIQLLKTAIKKEHPMYKVQQIQHKIVLAVKCIEEEGALNYFVKNFMLLSCLDNNVFSQVVFSSDVQFYFHLLLQLNVKGTQIKYYSQKISKNQNYSINNSMKQKGRASGQLQLNFHNFQEAQLIHQKDYKIFSINGSYQNCYTNITKLKQTLPVFLKKFYKKESLLIFIEKKIIDSIQKIQNGLNYDQSILNARLDIFKCCQLIMQSIFSYKLDVLKSYAQLTEIEQLSTFGLLNQQLFIDIIGFLKISKLEKLNTINKFRYDFGKPNTIQGISLINMVNFCLNHNIPDFDQILYDIIRNYPTNQQINKKIENLQTNYSKFHKLQNICKYLYHKNVKALQSAQSCNVLKQKLSNSNRNNNSQESLIKNPSSFMVIDRNICTKKSYQGSSNKLKFPNTGSNIKDENKEKDIWEIIGISASNSLIHFKVLQLEASQLLQTILGPHLTGLYMASLCQLQQKRHCLKTK